MDEIEDKAAQEEAGRRIRLALMEVLGAADNYIAAKREHSRTRRRGSSTVNDIAAAQDDEETAYDDLKRANTNAKAAIIGPLPEERDDD